MADQKWVTTSAGVKMPRLIYGTAWKKERTADLVVKAIQTGFMGIDTACQPRHYQEHLVGEAINRLKAQGIERNTLYLQTKFTPLSGQDPNNVPYEMDAPVETQIKQSFEVSRKNLQTEYLDTLVLHSPLAPHGLLMSAWQTMEAIQKSGGALQLGISNCYDPEVLKQLYADATIKPAIVQNRFYHETGYDTYLRKWCSEHGIIYQSFWTLTANPHILDSDTVQALTQKHRKTAPQIFFRYLSQIGIVPLTGTCSEQHMKEDLSIFEFELSNEDIADVSQLLSFV